LQASRGPGADDRIQAKAQATAYSRLHGSCPYGPGEGEHHDAGPAQIFIKATGEHTSGSFFLAESTLAPGFAGPPPHRHRELHDMFYVLEGTLTLRLGDQEIEAGPGSFACVPPGVVHTFRNDSDGPVRLLNFNTPAGWENYMRDVAKAAQSGPLTPEVMARVASRYDFEFIR
jgi:quercetin dioxygenase-like cupin family protein